MKLEISFLKADNTKHPVEATLDEAVELIRTFPWEEQLKEANELEKCSPSVSVKHASEHRIIEASYIGDEKGTDYLLFYIRNEKVMKGLFKKKEVDKEVMSDTDGLSLDDVIQAFRDFYNSDFEAIAEKTK